MNTPPIRLMILCGKSPRHLYVANRLCRAAQPVAIVQETGSERNGEKLRRLLHHPPLLWRKVWRWIRDRRRYMGGKVARFFFPDGLPRLNRPELLHEVPPVNHPRVLHLVETLKPDVIAVFGTSLIRGELLGKGRLGMVNLHGGLSPHYRGADGTFRALYNEEPHMVGCTLHFIDQGIDTGRLIAHVCPQVREGDDELSLFWRAVKDSAQVYAEVVKRLGRGERLGVHQREVGCLYQVKDRLWRHERELERKMRRGLLRGVDLPRRVTWFQPHERADRRQGP
ncbi:MAG: formyl transferase [Desulfosoma sp.]|uniref:formyl transferase n=1 Tax=Desulfosoma sp. TaxID=2603217 RepID=UPI00404AAA77